MRSHLVLVTSILLLGVVTAPVPRARACIWDTDTLNMELKGIPDAAKVIAGAFARNPPLYYEMRLERAAKQISENRLDFAAYDDAGAACDRIGRGDEALAWMEKKAQALAEAAAKGGDKPDAGPPPDLSTPRYRMLANVGTFRVHRWLRAGADRERIAEVETAADEIRAAIELNPDAHFGRERYQLRAMEWLIVGKPHVQPQMKPEKGPGVLHDFLGLRREYKALENMKPNDDLKRLGFEDATAGLSGLIVLGNAWESVDIFYALSLATQIEGKSSVALLARQRMHELIDAGRGSLVPGAPTGAALKSATSAHRALVNPLDAKEMTAAFVRARKNSDAWQKRRTAFMMERLEKGRHPDTDPKFWDGWTK